MEFFIFILIIIGFLIFVFYLFISISIKKFREKSLKSLLLGILVLLPVFTISYYIFDALYPNNSFYEYDFEEDTKLKFKPGWTIGSKYATFPDTFGDYQSAFILNVNEKDYLEIYKHFESDSSYEEQIPQKFEREFNSENSKNVIGKKIVNKEGGKFVYLLFINDKKTIIYERMSW